MRQSKFQQISIMITTHKKESIEIRLDRFTTEFSEFWEVFR